LRNQLQTSLAFAKVLISSACAETNLLGYAKRYDWLGDGYVVTDDVPRGTLARRIDPDMGLVCLRLKRPASIKALRGALVAADSTRNLTDRVCADVFTCPPPPPSSTRWHGDWHRAVASPRFWLRCAPHVLVFAFAPALLLPSFFPPRLPVTPSTEKKKSQ